MLSRRSQQPHFSPPSAMSRGSSSSWRSTVTSYKSQLSPLACKPKSAAAYRHVQVVLGTAIAALILFSALLVYFWARMTALGSQVQTQSGTLATLQTALASERVEVTRNANEVMKLQAELKRFRETISVSQSSHVAGVASATPRDVYADNIPVYGER
ncbi:MAG: hypothetical protein MHM6MM_006667 [Cercozoa sp. M6MM]